MFLSMSRHGTLGAHARGARTRRGAKPRTRSWVVRLAIAGVLLVAGAATSAAEGRGPQLFQLCQQCHGPEAQGREEFLAPAIAGLPQWYVQSSLEKFKSGVRGTHPGDTGGLRMYPMSLALKDDADIEAVSAHVAGLPRTHPSPTLSGGDPAKGKDAYTAVCKQCHGDAGQGNQQQQAPALAGASDWYLLSSLEKFKDGVRGTNPGDPLAIAMRGMTMTLADEQAMKDVVAYIMTLSD